MMDEGGLHMEIHMHPGGRTNAVDDKSRLRKSGVLR
jgi:hypothetical protein